ncbi:hypothetical protein CALVIDRAFT_244074 [Calocera viscosa TUFC12733]|uniref:Uncharacterized protein n=1 Tax=Calocera viscosa (strain TUFC12733) TaxID=1330018 RepID=A0A167JRA3_CALVF|nr:hypothetical protein CALVIDRAFT_244074 [Calocera viscosa TUFC12733]
MWSRDAGQRMNPVEKVWGARAWATPDSQYKVRNRQLEVESTRGGSERRNEGLFLHGSGRKGRLVKVPIAAAIVAVILCILIQPGQLGTDSRRH